MPACRFRDDRQENELQALAAIADLLMTDRPQHAVFADCLVELEQRLGFARAAVMLVSADDDMLALEAPRVSGAAVATYHRGEGILGRVLVHARPIALRSIAAEPAFQGRLHKRTGVSTRSLSFIGVPIQVGHVVVGTLSADLPYRSDAHLEEATRLLAIVGSLLAHGVHARRQVKAERAALADATRQLQQALGRAQVPGIIGASRPMREVAERIQQVAPATTSVLIRGASGTGKELVASAIHHASQRSDGPFIKVNCSALSDNLLESELFGHARGAFTGAVEERSGRLAEADGGTLFLDEIGEFSLSLQIKLLRVLQEREFEPVGSTDTKRVDVRIIAATNRNLEQAISDGDFREDFYYRINVFPIVLPALRERRDDILAIANHFVRHYADLLNRPVTRISTSAINALMSYHWPGNVRELENAIEYAVVTATDEAVHVQNLPPTLQVPITGNVGTGLELKTRVRALERDLIVEALKRHDGQVAAAAKELGVTERGARYKIANLDIDYRALFDGEG